MAKAVEILQGKNKRISSKRVIGIVGFIVACLFALHGNNEFAEGCLTFSGGLLLGGLAERQDV